MEITEATKMYIQTEVSRIASERGLEALRDQNERIWNELQEVQEKMKKTEEECHRLEHEIRQLKVMRHM